MGDFAQAGSICTLQRLNETHLATLEAELTEVAATRPIALILPCHEQDLTQPALANLRDELRSAAWLGEIVVSLNGVSAESFRAAKAFFAGWPQRVRLLWTDGPELRRHFARTLQRAPEELRFGKGFNVWAAIGLLSDEAAAQVVVTQDCDVLSFRREGLARLCFACAHPEVNFAFAKMYYPRATDRLYGRVSRLFLAPLLQTLVGVCGHQPLLDFLLSFRYPLAGEMALQRTVAESLPFADGWALEIVTLCEVFRQIEPRAICQVDGGSHYDHRHRPAPEGLTAMCRAIAEALLAQLAVDPVAVHERFPRESDAALQRYAALARINALPFSRHEEAALARQFAAQIPGAEGAVPLLLPAWQSLDANSRAALAAAAIQA